jgi:hypothetical protein
MKVKNKIGDYPILEDGCICHLFHQRKEDWMANKELFEEIVTNELPNVELPNYG